MTSPYKSVNVSINLKINLSFLYYDYLLKVVIVVLVLDGALCDDLLLYIPKCYVYFILMLYIRFILLNCVDK